MIALVPDLEAGPAVLSTPKERARRPIWISVAKDRSMGRLWWRCNSCVLSLEACGWSGSVAEAADQGLAHLLADCPAVAAASSKLLADVLSVPTFRKVAILDDGSTLLGCSLCPEYVNDASAHVAHHLAAVVLA